MKFTIRTIVIMSLTTMTVVGGCSTPSLTFISSPTANIHIYEGYGKQLLILATYSNGKQLDVSNTSAYKSSNEKIIGVNSTGFTVGNDIGKAEITISYTEGNVTKNILIPVIIEPFGGTDTFSGIS